ncbi:unnamed protein product [Peniophora sp. CBMAI 1063]|nr:unnamed protein product [Peniophora sp. CBMAI 1063]
MTSRNAEVQNLPDELLAEILLYLDCRSVLRCSQTCRRFHAIVTGSQGLQYIVELSLTGTLDGSPDCPQSTAERLQLLRARKRRRREFLPEPALSFSIYCPDEDYVYDFVDGIFAVQYFEDATGSDLSHLLAYDLSSTGAGRLLFHTQLNFALVDFSIDPSRNLIVCAEVVRDHAADAQGPEVRVHLLSLDSGGRESSPEASKGTLEVTDLALLNADDIFLTVAGDMVAYFSQSALYVWRWTTGTTLIHWELSTLDEWYNTFTFVSPTSFVVTESGIGCGALHLYALPSDDTMPTSISPEDEEHAQLCLPELPTHAAILSVHTGPFSTPRTTFIPSGSVLLLFVTATNEGVEDGQIDTELIYVISLNTLLKRCLRDQSLTSASSGQTVQKYRWSEWGPENSRLLPYVSDSLFAARGSHGSRVLMAVHKDDDRDQDMVYAYFDFADSRDRAFLDARQKDMAPSGPSARLSEMRTRSNRELFGARGLFEEPTSTALPYYTTETNWVHGDDEEILLGDERFVKKTNLVREHKIRLDVYDF